MYSRKKTGVSALHFLTFYNGIGTALFFCHLSSGQAQESKDVVRPYASATIRYDSNVFGLPDESAARSLGLDNLSDSSRTTRVGLRIKKEISRQVLSADLSVNALRFDRFAFLDTDGRELKANWNWHVGRTFEGDIGANSTRGLATFVTFNQPIKNTRNENDRYASIIWSPHPDWRASARHDTVAIEYDLPEIALSKRSENKTTFDLEYLASGQNVFGVQASRTIGNIPTSLAGEVQFGEDKFVQNALKAKVDWHVTAKTRIKLLAGPVARRQASPNVNNYRGNDVRASVNYQYSAKSNVLITAWQEVGIADDFTTIYSRNRGMSVIPTWKVTEKTSVLAEWRREHRDFSHSVINATNEGETLNFKLSTASIGVTYQMSNRVLLQPSLFFVKKEGSDHTNSFIRRGGFITLQYQY